MAVFSRGDPVGVKVVLQYAPKLLILSLTAVLLRIRTALSITHLPRYSRFLSIKLVAGRRIELTSKDAYETPQFTRTVTRNKFKFLCQCL